MDQYVEQMGKSLSEFYKAYCQYQFNHRDNLCKLHKDALNGVFAKFEDMLLDFSEAFEVEPSEFLEKIEWTTLP